MIKVTNLNKYFNKGRSNEIHVINDTCLELADTGLVCILGESGSGKTTLLNTIGGLDTFQKGSIVIGDTTINKYSPKEIEKLRNTKFGYVFQEQYLLQEKTVTYNILLALNMYELSTEEKEARVDYVLGAVGMKKFKKRLVSQLSGGQQQRVAIARALVKSPDIIFADEPTGNLDEVNTMRIMNIMKKISKDCLVILVTHERRIADFFADRLIQIQDGKIIKDASHERQTAYRYSDDTNIYLQEFEKESYHSNDIDINFFYNGRKNDITLNMVYKNNKFYIQAPDKANVVLLSAEDEMKVIDDVKPVLEINQVEDFEYSLARPKANKKPNLPFKEVYKLAKENVSMLGRRSIYIIISLIITSILLVIAVADYMTTISINKRQIITEDSHYVSIIPTIIDSESFNPDEYNVDFYNVYNELLKSKFAEDFYIDINASLSFSYEGYEQVNYLQYSMANFSYVTLEHFDEKDLICGRMPKKRNEIIVDEWLIDNFFQSDSIMKSFMTKYKDFIDIEVITNIMNRKLKIVGICDTGEPTVFIDKYMGLSISTDDSIASLGQLRAAYPGKYDDIQLAKDEILMQEFDEEENMWLGNVTMDENGNYTRYTDNGYLLKNMGSYPHEFDAAYVIDDAYYKDYLNSYIVRNGDFMIYANQKDLKTFSKELEKLNTKTLQLKTSSTYQNEMAVYNQARKVNMNARTIITMAIFIISIFMLFFSMKSNAIKRTQEIIVYRLMGITKKSILLSFVLETILITSVTVLPVVLVLSCIIKSLAAIPSLQFTIRYPWSAVAVLLVFLYAVNIIVGILSVNSIIKRPPAQMAV